MDMFNEYKPAVYVDEYLWKLGIFSDEDKGTHSFV